MKPGDFTPVLDKSGQMIGRRVQSVSGKEYVIGKKLGAGGVAKVFHATKDRDKKPYVFKEYVTTPDLRILHATIKRNIIKLIQLFEKPGEKVWPHFVPPLDLIELKSGGFGYIMEKVDLDKYKSVVKIINHHEYYPDAKILCEFCKNFVELFQTIHLKGWCYKDINEGNIYINPDNGDFFVIDCDNISGQQDRTILGTAGYIAPEVYKTKEPNRESDYFSIASFFFRLFIGSYPMDGPACESYMNKNELTVDVAAPKIYGTDALFAFHPTDKRNAVYAVKNNEDYLIQTRKWNALPIQIKKWMIQTFVVALHDDIEHRTQDFEWIRCFEDLENNHLVQCKSKKCGKFNFDNRKLCYCCGKELPIKPQPQKQLPIKPQYEVVFNCRRMVSGQQTECELVVKLNEKVNGNWLHPDFANVPMLYVKCEDENKFTIHNCSKLTWELRINGTRTQQAPKQEVQIKTGHVVAIDPQKCLLKVMGVRRI